MAGFSRVNGFASASSFYGGYQPLCIRVTDSGNNFTASTGGGTTAIVEGGYDKMVRAIESLGSIIILGAQANGAFTCVVDAGSFNAGGDTTNAGAYGIVKTLATAVANTIGTAGTIAVTTSAASPALTSAGAFTLA
jgi:hypothetical protein